MEEAQKENKLKDERHERERERDTKSNVEI